MNFELVVYFCLFFIFFIFYFDLGTLLTSLSSFSFRYAFLDANFDLTSWFFSFILWSFREFRSWSFGESFLILRFHSYLILWEFRSWSFLLDPLGNFVHDLLVNHSWSFGESFILDLLVNHSFLIFWWIILDLLVNFILFFEKFLW